MAIEFGSGLNGVATSALVGRTPSTRKSDRGQFGDDAISPRLGFGEGTVSSVGVAATTVDRNLESAKAIVPTLEELSAEARSRSEAVRDQAAVAEQDRVERGSADGLRNESAARAQAEGFVQREEASESTDVLNVERAVDLPPAFQPSTRNVESVVSVVAPDPAASFDVFG